MKRIFVVMMVSAATLSAGFTAGDDLTVTSSDGRQWQDDTSVRISTYNWEGALGHCEGLSFAGHDDWRVPNINELATLLDFTRNNPTVDAAFANTASQITPYWASTTYVDDSTMAWAVYFRNGESNFKLKTNHYHVRCVRGGE